MKEGLLCVRHTHTPATHLKEQWAENYSAVPARITTDQNDYKFQKLQKLGCEKIHHDVTLNHAVSVSLRPCFNTLT